MDILIKSAMFLAVKITDPMEILAKLYVNEVIRYMES
jgi:hypothetical protein